MKSKLVLTMVALTMAIALVAGGTMAWFTSNDDAGEAVFTAGILKVDVSDGLTTFDDLFAAGEGINKMNPGDVYDEIEIIIENTGNKKLIWFGNWTAEVDPGEGDVALTDALLDGIYVKQMQMEFLSPATGTWSEPTDLFIDNGVGAGAYDDEIDVIRTSDVFPVITLRDFIDNNTMGVSPFEHMGALKPGFAYKLTATFGFYYDADYHYMGDVAGPVKIGFEVISTQVVAEAITAIGIPNAASHVTWATGQLANQIIN